MIGAAMEIHKILQHGFLEGVYQNAFARELTLRGIPFEQEISLAELYKGERLSCSYRADFVCFSSIIVELKATEHLTGTDQAQVINYIRATGHR